MKKVDIYVQEEKLAEITETLDNHGVGGISIMTIRGKGKDPHDPVPEMVRSYMTGRHVIPEFVTRLKIEVIVIDTKVKPIVDDLSKLDLKTGKVFVHDIFEAYDISKKTSGESALD
ncbi:MAG: P-II family nitrogen regulator [Nitrososphaerota archaeon]